MLGKPTRASAALAIVGGALLVLAACSSSSDSAPAPAADAAPAVDAAEAGALPDAAPSVDAEAAVTCDLGALPAMPALTSEVIIEGTDAGTAPAPTGGDEAGLWLYKKITIYAPAAANGQIDAAKSMVTGKGFIELGGGKLRQFVDTTTTLVTTAVGTVTRSGTTKLLGTYTAAGTAVTTTVTCREATGDSSELGELGFSRVDPTLGKLHITTKTQLGSLKLVIDLEKQP